MHIDLRREKFLDIQFDNPTYEEVARQVEILAGSQSFSFIVTANVDHVLRLHPTESSRASAQFLDAYSAARMRLCDSRILKSLAGLKGVDLNVVTGSDLTALLFRSRFRENHTVAIVGGDAAMITELAAKFSGPRFVQHVPPMGVLQKQQAIRDIVEFVSAAQADFVFFAIGAPQSEIVAHACLRSGKCRGVGLCIGASIEFLLDRKSRAPVWMQRLSLEWAYRLFKEPRRLSRRYLVTGPRIFWLAYKWQRR